MTDNERINQIIEDAITILNDDTWCKGEERVPNLGGAVGTYRYCAVGALKEAAGFVWERGGFLSEEDVEVWGEAVYRCDKAVREMAAILCPCGCGDVSCRSIISYNDGHAESVEDVKLMMKRAIKT
jgi:hypothetical protein